jgi:hypothetical protein
MTMKRFKSLSAITFALGMAGCTTGQGDVDVSLTNVATFPGAPPEAAAELTGSTVSSDAFVTIDVQKDIESLDKFGTVTADISTDMVAGGDLSFIDHVKATMEAEDGSLPVLVLSDRDVPTGSATIDLAPLSVTDEQVLAYMSEGKVDVHFYITGNIPDRPVTLTYSLAAHLTVDVRGSVFKL